MTKMISLTDNKNIVHRNLPAKALLTIALARGEGKLAKNGALSVTTGRRTGRSPQDRFIVQDEVTIKEVDWCAINQPISTECFERLWQRAQEYLKEHSHFISYLAVGSDEKYQIPVTVITDLAWHQLFCYNAFIRTFKAEDPDKTWTLLNAAQFKTDPEGDGVKSDATLIIDFNKVNTGWTGGAYGEGGKRFDIPMTRTIINAILNGKLKKMTYEVMPNFKLAIPTSIKGVVKKLLNPINAWWSAADYNRHAIELIEAFIANFKKFKVSSEIITAGPELI